MTEPKVGQVWIDRDKRMAGRRVVVVNVFNPAEGFGHLGRWVWYKIPHDAKIKPFRSRYSRFVKAFRFEGEPTQGELKA